MYVVYYNYPSNSILRMSKQTTDQIKQLEYKIIDSYFAGGEGTLQSITKKQNGYWKSYIGTDRVKIKCKLKKISKNILIQIRMANINMIQVAWFKDQQYMANQMQFIKAKQRESKQSIIFKIKDQNSQIDKLQIELYAYDKRQIQIFSLIVYGFPIKSIPAQCGIQERLNKMNMIFQQRKKKKQGKNKNFEKIQKKQSKNQQKIEQEHKNQEQRMPTKKNNQKQQDLFIPQNYDKNDLLQAEEETRKASYKKIMVQQINLLNIKNVTQQWLQVQRKMEIHYGVKVQDRLSVKINSKFFANLKFCLPNIFGEEKSKYVKLVKEYGGLVREQLTQGCIVATFKPKGAQIGLAKLMAGVTIVKLSYLDDCAQSRMKLNPNKYQFHPLDFIGI